MKLMHSAATIGRSLAAIAAIVVLGATALFAGPPLKEARLIIEHNATAKDTGFQGFVDSEGLRRLDLTGPNGRILTILPKGKLAEIGFTELFFETVEPTRDEVALARMLRKLPEGQYRLLGQYSELSGFVGTGGGFVLLTHDIPKGPRLLRPREDAVVDAGFLRFDWRPVTETLAGTRVTIIAYQLTLEKVGPKPPNLIGSFGLSVYLPPDVTHFNLAEGFLEPGARYNWEVLAIEQSGNQTISERSFQTSQRGR